MADPERFKPQSPVTTDLPAVKWKTLCLDITCSHAMLTLLTLTI